MTVNVTIDRFQVRRSFTAGYRPPTTGDRALRAGETLRNYADRVDCHGVGDGTFIETTLDAVTPAAAAADATAKAAAAQAAAIAASVPVSSANTPGGYLKLGTDGKIPAAIAPASELSLGSWNASTNTPTLADASWPAAGRYYVVATAGTTSLGGVSSWAVGDKLYSTGSAWQRLPASAPTAASVPATPPSGQSYATAQAYLDGLSSTKASTTDVAAAQSAAIAASVPRVTAALSLKANLTGSTANASDITFQAFTRGVGIGILRSEIAAATIPLRHFTVAGTAAGGDYGSRAPYTVGTSTGPMAIQDAAGTWFQLDIVDRVLPGWFRLAGDADWTAAFTRINAYLATSGSVKTVDLGFLTYAVTSITFTVSGVNLISSSSAGAVILGSQAAGDILIFGDGTNEIANCLLQNFIVDSSISKTSGAAIHMRKFCRSILTGVRCPGQNRAQVNKYLYDGFWFDSVDCVFMDNFEAAANHDGIIVNGGQTYSSGPQGDLFLVNGKVGGCPAAGVRCAGGFGGLVILATDIIANGNGLYVDSSKSPATGSDGVANPNREIYLGPGAFIDSSTHDGIRVEQSLNQLVVSGGWSCSASGNPANSEGNGLRINSMYGQVIWDGLMKGNAGSAIRCEDARTQFNVRGALFLNGRYGIEWTVTPNNYSNLLLDPSTRLDGNTIGPSSIPIALIRPSTGSIVEIAVFGPPADLRLTMNGGLVDFNGAVTAGSAGAGGGAALPATVAGYLRVKISGGEVRIPYYPVS